MKDKTSGSASRLKQVAEELHRLADNLGAGSVKIGGVELSISESVTLKVKQKMTGKKVIFDLKIQALLAEDEILPVSGSPKKTKTRTKNKRPYGVKAEKKKYTALWRQISSAIKKGECPDALAVADLEEVSKEYGAVAPPEWAGLWLACEALIGRCVGLAQAGDFTAAQQVLIEIGLAKKSCHNLYK
ncbi:MAG: hypothetical protein PF442_09280 [Desulfobulbaceae bacterium]|jgi:hypothetical protein|nr:hypothetical protein [Desulfobulbaceae bacterium]